LPLTAKCIANPEICHESQCAHHFFDGKRRTATLPQGFIHQSITEERRIVPEKATQ